MKVNINQYIEYRINRAKETFQDAEYLAENKRWNSWLFDFRQKGDYGDLFDFTETKVKPLIEPTKKFISIIIEYLDTAEGKGLRAES